MAVYFYQTLQFEAIRSQIEHYLYDSVFENQNNVELALRSVERFAHSIETSFRNTGADVPDTSS